MGGKASKGSSGVSFHDEVSVGADVGLLGETDGMRLPKKPMFLFTVSAEPIQ